MASSSIARRAGQLLGVSLAAWLLSRADLTGAARLIAGTPGLIVLLPLTYAVAAGLEVYGFRVLLGARGVKPGLGWLLRFRVMSDALVYSIPSGTLVAEGLNYTGLTRTHGVAHRPAIVVLLLRRVLVACAHGTVALCGAWVGRDFLRALAPAAGVGEDVLQHAPALLVALLAIAALVISRARTSGLALTETSLPPGNGLMAFALFLASWIAEAVDTYLVLLFLGAGLPFIAVLSFEGLLSLLRSLAIFVPAGLGVQDLGYLLVLQGLGVPGAAVLGTAFLLLKRSRELVLVIVGWIGLGREWPALRFNPATSAL